MLVKWNHKSHEEEYRIQSWGKDREVEVQWDMRNIQRKERWMKEGMEGKEKTEIGDGRKLWSSFNHEAGFGRELLETTKKKSTVSQNKVDVVQAAKVYRNNNTSNNISLILPSIISIE